TPGASCRSMPPVFRLWKHETSVMSSLLSRARRFALPRAIRAITLCPAVPSLATRVADFEESRPCRLPPSTPPTSMSSTSRASAWRRNAPRLAPVLRRVKGVAWFKNEHDDEAAAPLADLTPERLAELGDELTRTRDGQLVLGRVVPAEQAARWTEAQYRDTA